MKLTKFKTNLDRGATYLFPLMFSLFNLFYWSYYLFITSQNTKHPDGGPRPRPGLQAEPRVGHAAVVTHREHREDAAPAHTCTQHLI